MSLSIYDFRDLDLMLKLDQVGDNEGWVSTEEFASALGMSESHGSVAIRSSWMRRYGLFDYNAEKKMWRLSETGARVTKAKLKAAQAKTIDEVPDESMVDVMAHVATRYRLGDPAMAVMLRREFLYGTSPRSTIWTKK